MEGEENYSEDEGSFSKASFWKKAVIVLAGPIVNILFGLCVYFILITVKYGIIAATQATFGFVGLLLESIKILVTGGATMDDLAGPIGIAKVISQTSGLADFAYLLSVISLSLGITNLLPIPPLDGGKLLIYVIELIKRKPLKEEISLKLQMLGFAFIIGLSIIVMWNDFVKLTA